MTLNLFITSPWGVWMSSDFRLTDFKPGHPGVPRTDHWSTKMVHVQAPDGVLLITYTGLGEVRFADRPTGLPSDDIWGEPDARAGVRRAMAVSEWLLWMLEGTTRTIPQTIEHIRVAATQKFPPRGPRHIFTVAGFENGIAGVAQVGNLTLGGELDWHDRSRPDFWSTMTQVGTAENPGASGALGLTAGLSKDDIKLLHHVARHKPRDPTEYMDLLASINERAASRTQSIGGISPACQVGYLQPPGREPHEPGATTKLYHAGQDVPSTFHLGLHTVLFGMNAYPATRSMIKAATERRVREQGSA
jgi:hypothetical protein